MNEERNLSTADFAAAAERRDRPSEDGPRADQDRDRHGMARELRETRADDGLRAPPAERVMPQPPQDVRQEQEAEHAQEPRRAGGEGEQLAALFLPQVAQNFRSQWDEVQIGFVDDPANAVRRADELVAQVMKNLAQTFAEERSHVEGEMSDGDTEHMRVALRRYRSFFQRLLSL
jgi:hypothetical protein